MISISELLIPSTFTPRGPHADRLAMLADELAYRTSSREEYQNGHWINFGRDCWKRISSKSYGDIKEAAVQQGLIDLNEKYSNSDQNTKGRPFPKSLRLTKEHCEADLVPYTLTKPVRRNPESHITIDTDDDVGMWLAGKLKHAAFKSDLNLAEIESSCKSQAARNCLRGSEHRVRRGRLHASRCSYGRFHSNFTNMKKELRRQLAWNGEPLIALDIKNSQPALLPYVIGRHIGEKEAGRHIGETLERIEQDTVVTDSFREEISIVAISLGIMPGKFYERAAVSLDQPKLPRKEIKTSFFESLYGRVETTRNSTIFKLIEQVSPSFAAAILDLKRNNHAALAHALQRTESDIVIDQCCRRLMESEPEMPLITVHDELMTTAEHKKLVVYQLTTAFFETCGYPCALSVTEPS